MSGSLPLERFPVHLGRAGSACAEPEFTGIDWYEAYGARHAGDGADGRLVSLHRFTRDWDGWEMHPAGDELVLCVAGTIALRQEHADGATAVVTLRPGDYAINPPGTWHTADIAGEATAVFVTAGLGTRHRPR
ncbi:MAG: cupin domain-containing protein [Novosphingobium sp.]